MFFNFNVLSRQLLVYIERGSMMEKTHPDLRIISRALESKGEEIAGYLSKMLEGVNMEDPTLVLRASQDIATNYHALMFQFRELAGKNFDLGIIQQFRGDIKRLWDAGALHNFARDIISAYGEFEPVENAAVKYFRDAEHHGKRSERYVMPILPMMYWNYGLGCLRAALQKKAMEISSVGEKTSFPLIVEDEFKSVFLLRKAQGDARPMEGLYALCGVHGGRDTDGYTVAESLKYLCLHNRTPLTFREAVLFFTAHPRFLLEQDRVILLEEEYPVGNSGMVKYAFLSSPHSDYSLRVGLVSKDEADKVFVTTSDGRKLPRYGKPSAATFVVPW